MLHYDDNQRLIRTSWWPDTNTHRPAAGPACFAFQILENPLCLVGEVLPCTRLVFQSKEQQSTGCCRAPHAVLSMNLGDFYYLGVLASVNTKPHGLEVRSSYSDVRLMSARAVTCRLMTDIEQF